jgi:hypothetical protein
MKNDRIKAGLRNNSINFVTENIMKDIHQVKL